MITSLIVTIILLILGIFGIKSPIFLCKTKWAIAALIFYFSEEKENPMKTGKVLAIEPNEDTITGGFNVKIIKKNHLPLDVYFSQNENPIEKWKIHIGDLVCLPCSVI